MSKSFWEWAGFFSRVFGGVLVVATFVGFWLGWFLPDAVAFGMCFSGLALVGFGLLAEAIASDK